MLRDAQQRHRINRVMNFARQRNAEALTLDSLADVACLSRYHFSRVFTDSCEETPIEFLSRMRLEQSVSDLIFLPGMPVTAVAFEAGFSSSQSFSNAFRRRYGISPRSFRAKNSWYIKEFPMNQYVHSPEMAKLPAIDPHVSQNRDVVFKIMPETRVAYIRHRGAYYSHSDGRIEAFARINDWAKRQGIWHADMPIFCACPDNPAVTPPHFCQYDVCVPIEDGVNEDDLVSIQYLPGTTLATLKVVGSAPEAREAWRWLVSQWLPRSGRSLAIHNFYELFRASKGRPCHPESEGTLCVPVTQRHINLTTAAANYRNALVSVPRSCGIAP